MQSCDLHVSPLHAAVRSQEISHEHAEPQLRSVHEFSPEQLTLHAPPPHANLSQLPRPEHVMLQDRPVGHVTPLRQELVVEHSTLQAQPSGHLTGPLHAPPLSRQSMLHDFTSRLHDVHAAGHRLASIAGAASIGMESCTLASACSATQK